MHLRPAARSELAEASRAAADTEERRPEPDLGRVRNRAPRRREWKRAHVHVQLCCPVSAS